MKEPHTEGGSDFTVTPSDGLAVCKDRSQAFTGARAGQLLSHEINEDRGADTVVDVEGNTAGGAIASRERTPRGLRTWHARNLYAGEPGGPVYALPPDQRSGRLGKAEAVRPGCTSRGVVSARSTKEAAEQISARGSLGRPTLRRRWWRKGAEPRRDVTSKPLSGLRAGKRVSLALAHTRWHRARD